MPATLMISWACRSRMMNGLVTVAAVPMAVALRSLRRFKLMCAPRSCTNVHAARKMPAERRERKTPAVRESDLRAFHPAFALLPGAGKALGAVFRRCEEIGRSLAACRQQFFLDNRMGLALPVGQQVFDLHAALGETARHQHGAMAV